MRTARNITFCKLLMIFVTCCAEEHSALYFEVLFFCFFFYHQVRGSEPSNKELLALPYFVFHCILELL